MPKKKKAKESDEMTLEMQMRTAEDQAEARLKKLMEKARAEEKIIKTNMHKVNEQWRKILRQSKLKDLKNDIEDMAKEHEHLVDSSDAQLQFLEKNVQEANQQTNMAMKSYNRFVSEIIEMHSHAAAQLEKEFTDEVDALRKDFEQDKATITAQHEKDVQELKDIISAMEAEFEDSEQEARQAFLSKRDFIKSTNTEEYETLKQTQQHLIKELEGHFLEAHDAYKYHSRDFTKSCDDDNELDKTSAEQIQGHIEKLESLQQDLQHWRIKHQNNVQECERRNENLRQEKAAVSNHFQTLKTKMNKMRQREEVRLMKLTKDSDRCITALEEKLKLGERILKLADMGRKLESEREKIAPFYVTSEDDVKEAEVEAKERMQKLEHSQAVDQHGNPVPVDEALDQFYKRFNKTLLDKVILEKHRSTLQRENDELRAILKQYLDGISVSEEVLSQENPLLIVNSRTNVPLEELAKARRHQNVNNKTGHPVYNVVESSTVMNTPYRVPQ